jgi:transcriptional antiterminator NusG
MPDHRGERCHPRKGRADIGAWHPVARDMGARMNAPYIVGMVLPYIKPRGILGAALAFPVWHALHVPPQREAIARNILQAAGLRACYPEETRHRWRGKERSETLHPMVSRLVYAKLTHAPHWDVLKDRRIITGVVSHDDRPIALTPDTIRSVMGLPTTAERIAAAQAEAQRIRPGDRALLKAGPFAGLVVDVLTVNAARVAWDTPWGKGETLAGDMVRLDATQHNR